MGAIGMGAASPPAVVAPVPPSQDTAWQDKLRGAKLTLLIEPFNRDGWEDPDDWSILTDDDLTKYGCGPGHIARWRRLLAGPQAGASSSPYDQDYQAVVQEMCEPTSPEPAK